jgi:hypothetical protein
MSARQLRSGITSCAAVQSSVREKLTRFSESKTYLEKADVHLQSDRQISLDHARPWVAITRRGSVFFYHIVGGVELCWLAPVPNRKRSRATHLAGPNYE